MSGLTDLEKQEARQRQQERYREAAAKHYAEREHLRGEIKSREYISLIHDSIIKLFYGEETLETPAGERMVVELDRTRQAGIKAAMDGAFKMLNKTVPDLKQIEVSSDIHTESTNELVITWGGSDAPGGV